MSTPLLTADRSIRFASCLSVVALTLVTPTLVACVNPEALPSSGPAGTDPVTQVSIDQRGAFNGSIMLDVGDQAALTATEVDTAGVVVTRPMVWSTNSPTIASVSAGGAVTALAPGTAIITVSVGRTSDARSVQVVQLNLTAYQLSVHATDDAGVPLAGGNVSVYYYGGRLPSCFSCILPYGNSVVGTTDPAGTFTGNFVATPDGFDEVASGDAGTPQAHTFSYVTVQDLPNYETDRRFVQGTLTTTTLTSRLHPLLQVTGGDSLPLTIAATDPLYQDPTTAAGATIGYVSRSLRVHASAEGFLTINVASTTPGVSGAYVEIDTPDETGIIAEGTNTATCFVHAGDVVQVQIATPINPGEPARSFFVRTVQMANP